MWMKGLGVKMCQLVFLEMPLCDPVRQVVWTWTFLWENIGAKEPSRRGCR